MKKVKVIVTLARAHKIADRLQAKIGQVRNDIVSFRSVKSFSRAPTVGQALALTQSGVEFVSTMVQYERMNEALCQLRMAVGRANAKGDVNDALTRIEFVKRTLDVFNRVDSNLKDAREGGAMSLLDAQSLEWEKDGGPVAVNVPVTQGAVAFDVVTGDAVKRLERELFELQDKLAELNATTCVTVALEEDIANALGIDG